MDNIVLTFSSQDTSPITDNQSVNPESTSSNDSQSATMSKSETINSTPLESVSTPLELSEKTNTDGNVQAHIEVKYEAHDVALASAKAMNDQKNNGFKANQQHKIDIVDSDQHPDKSKIACFMLNKLYLILAIVFFTLLLFSIGYIILHAKPFDAKTNRSVQKTLNYLCSWDGSYGLTEKLIDGPYYNLTHPTKEGIRVVLSRRGASVNDILIPYKDDTGLKAYRSIVIKGGNENNFGTVRAGFTDPNNTMNLTGQLPGNHPFLNLYKEDWLMYVDSNNPNRVRFVYNSTQIIYECSWNNPNELMMKTIVSALPNQQIVTDLTNNIYFNLRGSGNLNTHYLNLSASSPWDIMSGKKVEQDRLIRSQQVDKLSNINKYFYKFDNGGIGKNYVATLFETETRTIMRMFSDHAGVIIDPFGVGLSGQQVDESTVQPEMRGIRISPRQSPNYQPHPNYGSTLVVYPSEAIHTTWWQFDYQN